MSRSFISCKLFYTDKCVARSLCYSRASCIIPMHISTNVEKLLKIALVVAEIFGWICRFSPSHPKTCICYPRNLCSYRTDLHQICIECILPYCHWIFFNQNGDIVVCFRTPLCRMNPYTKILPKNWLPWQRPSRNRKKSPDGSSTNKCLWFGENGENLSSRSRDRPIIWLQLKI